MSPSPKEISVVNCSTDSTPSVQKPVVSKSVIEGEFAFNNCADIHIGPKHEHINNIVISKSFAESCEGEISRDLEILRKELKSTKYEGISHKYPVQSCYLQFKVVLVCLVVVFSTLLLYNVILHYKEDTLIPSTSNNHVDIQTKMSTLSPPTVELESDYPIESKFVSRSAWGARPPQPVPIPRNNTLPVKRVIFIHTVAASTCNNYEACRQQLHVIQDTHMNAGYGDIGYNFVIGSDGFIYVGVGWDKVGAHSYGYNTGSLGIAFVGDFRTDEPNKLMLLAAKSLLSFGVEITKLSEDYQLFAHCQLMTAFPYSPGKNIVNQLKLWPHWNSTNINGCAGLSL